MPPDFGYFSVGYFSTGYFPEGWYPDPLGDVWETIGTGDATVQQIGCVGRGMATGVSEGGFVVDYPAPVFISGKADGTVPLIECEAYGFVWVAGQGSVAVFVEAEATAVVHDPVDGYACAWVWATCDACGVVGVGGSAEAQISMASFGAEGIVEVFSDKDLEEIVALLMVA